MSVQYLPVGKQHLSSDSSEAFNGAIPKVNNSPQKPPFGLRTERLSGTAFTAPRAKNLQTWMYRKSSSLVHSEYVPVEDKPLVPSRMTPNGYVWPNFPTKEGSDWLQQKLVARNGDPATKHGVAIWMFAVSKDMAPCTALASLDGDLLIVLQSGALDIQTELGRLLVRQNEIAMIPRGLKHRVTLADGTARGQICELYQGHWDLPELGPIGSTGLANVRDFEVPTAFFDERYTDGVISANDTDWTITCRLQGQLWSCTQDHTPFDVAGWHGTFYPFKYDLAKYVVLGNVLFDEHDPSLYVILSASSGDNAGASAVDFLVIPPRWQVSDALWLPYYHRNTHSEYYGPIVNQQDPKFPPNRGLDFSPFAAGLNGMLTTHGAPEEAYQEATNADLKPAMLQNDGFSIFLIETEKPLFLSEWAYETAVKNPGSGPKPKL